ncbi:MAG: hypothetical protein KJ621_10325 [Proteobacteria bacterium]|nr:hypothetical protein [Pseudomonadota bacterium]
MEPEEKVSRNGQPPPGAPDERTERGELVAKELICLGALSVALLVAALILPAALGPPPDAAGGPDRIEAPWLFAGVQYLMRFVPAWLGGLVIPAVALLFVAALPWLARFVPRYVYLPVFGGLLVAGAVLTALGLSH